MRSIFFRMASCLQERQIFKVSQFGSLSGQVPADIIQRMLDLIQVGFRRGKEIQIFGDNANIKES